MTEKLDGHPAPEHESDDPKCDKCGAPIDSGIMAVGCPSGKDCEFWTPELDEFMAMFKEKA